MRRSLRNGATLVVVASVVMFAGVLGRHEPLGQWLSLRYFRAAASALVFSFACLVAGHALVLRALGRTQPFVEHLALACPLGVLAFYVASFALSSIGLGGPASFVLCPVLLVALGAREFLRTAKRLRHHSRHWMRRPAFGALGAAALVFGVLGVAYLWFVLLTPLNASYDARWFHLPIAEAYASGRGIAHFEEGWVHGAYPHLASLLYAWALGAPGSLFDRIETAAHLELAIFVMTLLGVPAIVRRLLGRRAPLSWVAVFLFPGIFCYDSGLVLGADHVAALFSPAIFLLSLRYLEAPSRGGAFLLGAVLAGAVATKYSALIVLPLSVAIILARVARDVRTPRATRVWAPAWAVVPAFVVLTAPHWLKNWLAYGDPLFPLLRGVLPAHPWTPAAEAPYATWFHLHRPPLDVHGLWEMTKTLVTFSFVPHDFSVYHGDIPVFGSLFTLCTPLLAFLGRRPRLFWLFAGTYLGIAAWFWIHQFDRYLQVLVPWMAAATAAVLALLWRERGALRWAVGSLVALQVVWGAAIPFFPSHRASGSTIVKVVVDLLGRGFRGESKQAPAAYPDWEAIDRALPKDAKLLVHEERIRAGLSMRTVVDFPGEQGVFYWGEPGASTPLEIWKALRARGISHVMWRHGLNYGYDTVAGALAFLDFVTHHTALIGRFGTFNVARLRDEPPPAIPAGEVAYATCEKAPPAQKEEWNPDWTPLRLLERVFASGLYPLESMARAPGDTRPVRPPAPGIAEAEAVARARFLVLEPGCHEPLARATLDEFETLAMRGRATLYVRKQALLPSEPRR
jgi:hypothetical protein